MTSMPSHVDIGGTPYTVVELFEDSPLDGEYSASKQEIGFRGRLPASYERYILAHEIVHGIFEHAGVAAEGDEKYTEEQVACIIGRALPGLLRNNPALVAYFTE